MWRHLLAVCVLAGQVLGCTTAATGQQWSFLGQQQVGRGELFGGTVIGGLSAISYDPADKLYYVVSDDKGDHGPIRFYTVDLALADNGIRTVKFVGMHVLAGPTDGVDAEGIAVDPQRRRLYWSTEGGRPADGAGPVTPQPWIRMAGLDGSNRGEFLLPPNFVVSPDGGHGMRPNNGLEGLTLAPDGRSLFAGVEEPLYGDDAELTRITQFDVESAKPVAQFAYRLERPPPGRANGLSDLVALSDSSFLVIERAGGPGPTIRIYHAEIGSATNTLDMPTLSGDVEPMTKTLVADLSASGGPVPLDNVEGITLGPELPDGRRSVVLVSDDNFNPEQVTQFLLFAH